MYIERESQAAFTQLKNQFKTVLVTGARQVGKTTMLKHCTAQAYQYVTLDDPRARLIALDDPTLFFKDHIPPVVVDEIQRVPSLFDQVKYLVDQSPEKGTIVLTGSQTYHLMQGVSESLAGRVAVLELGGLSLRETLGTLKHEPYVPSVKNDSATQEESFAAFSIWDHIWRGSMPELQDKTIDWDFFYSNYTSTYLERDVRELIKVRDEEKFYRFIVACAARTGQLLNADNLASDIGIDTKTAQSWISVLQASGIIRLLRPFHTNIGKRLTKTPKLFFADTGLVCHLLGWISPETLKNGAMAGEIFETFVVSEIIKSYLNAGRTINDIFFYRDAQKREIDMLIKRGQTLHPIEIKKGATPGKESIASFGALDSLAGFDVGDGAVVCQTDKSYLISETVRTIAPWMI